MPDFETPAYEAPDPESAAIARQVVERQPDADMLLDMLGLADDQ